MATTLAGRIQAAREAAGLNQSELARALGVSPQTVQHWEAARTGVRGARLRALADVLKVTPEWLMFGEVSRPPNDESVSEARPRSQPARPDPAMLSAALDWLDFEEGPRRHFAYQGVARGARLLELYAMIEADGGAMSPSRSRALIAAAEQRFSPRGNHETAENHGRKAGPAK